jgi:hypothetical protein
MAGLRDGRIAAVRSPSEELPMTRAYIVPWLDRMDRHFDDQGFNGSAEAKHQVLGGGALGSYGLG